MATAIFQNDGSNITGFSAGVPVDKGFQRGSAPKVHTLTFGDGYEQRIADGINNLAQQMNVTFNTRPKAEIDDLVAFFESLGGVSKFRMTKASPCGDNRVYRRKSTSPRRQPSLPQERHHLAVTTESAAGRTFPSGDNQVYRRKSITLGYGLRFRAPMRPTRNHSLCGFRGLGSLI